MNTMARTASPMRRERDALRLDKERLQRENDALRKQITFLRKDQIDHMREGLEWLRMEIDGELKDIFDEHQGFPDDRMDMDRLVALIDRIRKGEAWLNVVARATTGGEDA